LSIFKKLSISRKCFCAQKHLREIDK